MSEHNHHFSISSASRFPSSALGLPTFSSSPPPATGAPFGAHQVTPLDPQAATSGLLRAGTKRGRDDSAYECEIASVSGQDKKAHAPALASQDAGTAAEDPAQAGGLDRNLQSILDGIDRQIVTAIKHHNSLPLFLADLKAEPPSTPQERDRAIEHALTLYLQGKKAARSTPVKTSMETRDMLEQLASGLAGKDADASRFDQMLIDILSHFDTSEKLADLTNDCECNPASELSTAGCELLRSSPPPIARFLRVAMQLGPYTTYDSFNSTNDDLPLSTIVTRLCQTPGSRSKYRDQILATLRESSANIPPGFIGHTIAGLTASGKIGDDPQLVDWVLDAPSWTPAEKGAALLAGQDVEAYLLFLEKPVRDDLEDLASIAFPPDIGAIVKAATTPAKRIAAVTSMLAAYQQGYENLKGADATGIYLSESVRYQENQTGGDTPSLLDDLRAALQRAVAHVSADCSPAQRVELVYRLNQVDPAPDRTADPAGYKRRVAALMPALSVRGDSKASGVSSGIDRIEMEKQIAHALRLRSISAQDCGTLTYLSPAEQATIYFAGEMDGKPYTLADFETLLDQMSKWKKVPAALRAAIVERTALQTVAQMNPVQLRRARQDYVAASVEAARQSAAQAAPLAAEQERLAADLPARLTHAAPLTEQESAVQRLLDKRSSEEAVALTDALIGLEKLYRGYLDAAGMKDLLAAPRPLQQPHRQRAEALLHTLDSELVELMDTDHLWERAKGNVGWWLRTQRRALRSAL